MKLPFAPSTQEQTHTQQPTLSVVVPVFNEEGSIETLHRELVLSLDVLRIPYELIFVNDGSTDTTQSVLESLSPATIITLPHNKGQSTAMRIGLKHAQGAYIATLDADGQNPPHEIPRMFRQLMANPSLDVISGWRKYRHDTIGKRVASRAAYVLRQALFRDGIRDAGCSLRVYRREAVQNLPLRGEMHRFMLPIMMWNGSSVAEMVVHHRSRTSGTTKYTWKRGIRSLRDMLMLKTWKSYRSMTTTYFQNMATFSFGLALATAGLAWYSVQAPVFNLSSTGISWLLVAVTLSIVGLLSTHLHTHTKTVLTPDSELRQLTEATVITRS